MIIFLPGSASDYTAWESRPDLAKQYRMGFFHFSNNNLSIRRACAQEIGGYDRAAEKSEDVDLCFRVARSPEWIALREQGSVVRHKARRSFQAFVRQMWGWGYFVGYPYAKTGLTGLHLYWVSSSEHRVKLDLEIPGFPFLICMFWTDFHVFHVLAALAVVAGLLGYVLPALAAGAAGLFFAWRYLHDDRTAGLGFWKACQLAAIHYCANVVFTVAAVCGALKHRVLLLPSSIFRPTAPKETSTGRDEERARPGAPFDPARARSAR